jgi:mannose-6-phosphate isomerase-like protein (cupin superfamily)
MKAIEKKTLNSPQEKREFPKGQVELVTIGDVTFGRGTFYPGWKWSESVKPIAKTDSCLAPHTQYHVSGRLHVKMDDGTEMEYGPGDIGVVPPGHDAWVIGNEPAVVIDITGLTHYAETGKHDH